MFIYLLTRLHNDCDSRDEIGRLLSHFGGFIVESPQNRTADLRQVRLHALTESVDNRAEPVQHHNVLKTRQTIMFSILMACYMVQTSRGIIFNVPLFKHQTNGGAPSG